MRAGPADSFQRLLRAIPGNTMLRLLIGFTACAAAVATIGSITGARSLRNSYGNHVEVAVARTELHVGQVITEQDFERRQLPESLIGAGVASDPLTRTVIEPILAGEPIMDRRLSGSEAAGIDALIGPRSRAITIERSPTTPAVEPGDRVDLFAPAVRGGAVRVARRSRVLAADDQSVTVAVLETEAPAVAGASIEKILSILLIGAG